ncbi:hypothetical protein Psch_00477 [Pelotomaculum schinkii]|uniref:Uncharacterized protein n=1 Tax=Pelotomaculum schinkii TaxID=78350 RepID=A0A4Y7RDU9_9FIRM|nr:hypothetical protein Psch_00477 [Pelotomaculum schinkii]TEB16895.1 hypothetical protein Psfp_01066 [Pelotomaculum sp. FP]
MAEFVEMQTGFGNPAFIFFLIFILLVFGVGCCFFI